MIKSKEDISKILSDGEFIKRLNITENNYNSEASLYEWLGDQYVIRKIGRQYILSDKKLVTLEANMNSYYFLLKKIIPKNLPKIFFTEINKKNKCIFLVTEYFPKSDESNLNLFKEIVGLLIKLTNSKDNYLKDKLICSIDPNPDNFFLGLKAELIYNDFTPPFYRENGKWLEFKRLDELHSKKLNKEKRYFSAVNLLMNFLNKARLRLSVSDYLGLIEWVLNKIQKTDLRDENNIYKIQEINNIKNDLKKEVTTRDILRFHISLREDLTNAQIKEIYKESKKKDGVSYLKNIIKGSKKANSNIYIARHGQTEWNEKKITQGQSESNISSTGIKQVEMTAQELKNVDFSAVYSSDLSMAYQTATIIKLDRKLDIVKSKSLRGRFYGSFEGKPIEFYKNTLKDKLKERDMVPESEYAAFKLSPIIESDQEMMDRFMQQIKEIHQMHPTKNVLVVTHGGCIKNFLMEIKYVERKSFVEGSFRHGGYMKVSFDGKNFSVDEMKGMKS